LLEERPKLLRLYYGDQIAAYLADLDVDAVWEAATKSERRTLTDEMIEAVDVHDHLEVTVRGAPKLNQGSRSSSDKTRLIPPA